MTEDRPLETSSEPLSDRAALGCLGVIVSAAVVLPLVFHLGPRLADHFSYVGFASGLLRGEFPSPESLHGQRLGLILPLAALQALTGTWDVSSAILTVSGSVLHVLAVYLLGSSIFDRRVGLWAAALVAALPLETIHGSVLFPDLLTTALGTTALAALHRETGRPFLRVAPLVGAGALLGWAYLVKQTAVFHLLLVGAWALSTRRWKLGWVALPFALALAAEMVVFGLVHGDPFLRSRTASAAAGHLAESWYTGPTGLADRLLWQVPSVLLNPLEREFPYLMGLPWMFAGSAGLLRRRPETRSLLGAVGLLVACIWLWPVRLSPYIPALVAEGRHLFQICAPMAILVAVGLMTLSKRTRWLLVGGWAAACLAVTALIHGYLSRQDEGDREAYRFLRSSRAERVRVVDPYGHESALYRYLEGPAGRMRLRPYGAADLGQIHGEHVVLNDLSRVGSRAARDLAVPSGWGLVWEKTFSSRWDPRERIRGRPSGGEYRVRVFFAP